MSTSHNRKEELVRALRSNDLEKVGSLVTDGMDVNAATNEENGKTALHLATENSGSYKVVNLLIEAGANVNVADECGWTPLHNVCVNGDLKVAELLLKHGARVNAVEQRNGSNPLYYACRGGHEGVVKLMLRKGAHDEGLLSVGLLFPAHFSREREEQKRKRYFPSLWRQPTVSRSVGA